jgi:hypothetical protein
MDRRRRTSRLNQRPGRAAAAGERKPIQSLEREKSMLRISEFFEEPDRRAHERFVPPKDFGCWLTDLESGQRWEAKIQDVSAGGVSLIVDREFAAETLLSIEIFTPTGTCLCTLRLSVVHIRPRAEGAWLIGCALATKLGKNELRGLKGDS